jgi:glycosyltransferase involved in cell wall biosynthesis
MTLGARAGKVSSALNELPRLLLCSFEIVPGPTGTSRRLTEYVKGLSSAFQVVILTVKAPDQTHIERYHGARLLRVPVGVGDLPSRLQAFDRAVRRQLESEDFAAVHFTDPFGGHALCDLRKDYGYRIVYDAQTFPSHELPFVVDAAALDVRFLSKMKRQELFCLMNADRVITGSKVSAEYLRGFGVAEDVLRILPAPVDCELYRPELLGAPDALPMKALYVGSGESWQGLGTLLGALRHAQNDADVRLTLLLSGRQSQAARLRELVDHLGLSTKVHFQLPVAHDDLFKIVASCDVGVLPLDDVDRNRKLGGALAKVSEYFAGGRPVIASDLPANRERLPESTTLFFTPGKETELAARLVELAKNPQKRLTMGNAARAFARSNLDSPVVCEQLVQIYGELLGLTPVRAATPPEVQRWTFTFTPTERLGAGASLAERGLRPNRAERSFSAEMAIPEAAAPEATQVVPELAPLGSNASGAPRAKTPPVLTPPTAQEAASAPEAIPLPGAGGTTPLEKASAPFSETATLHDTPFSPSALEEAPAPFSETATLLETPLPAGASLEDVPPIPLPGPASPDVVPLPAPASLSRVEEPIPLPGAFPAADVPWVEETAPGPSPELSTAAVDADAPEMPDEEVLEVAEELHEVNDEAPVDGANKALPVDEVHETLPVDEVHEALPVDEVHEALPVDEAHAAGAKALPVNAPLPPPLPRAGATDPAKASPEPARAHAGAVRPVPVVSFPPPARAEPAEAAPPPLPSNTNGSAPPPPKPIDADISTADFKLDPWLAQLVHGYVPAEAAHFAHSPPSTTFPATAAPTEAAKREPGDAAAENDSGLGAKP